MTDAEQLDLAVPRSLRLPQRQQLLLGLLGVLGGNVGATDFQKLLFLFCQEQRRTGHATTLSSSYDFVPYKRGAFSFTCYADRRRLVERGLLVETEQNWSLSTAGHAVADSVSDSGMGDFARRYRNLRGDALIAESYRKYPYYATRSEIAKRVLGGDREALRRVQATRPKASSSSLMTIGYEGLTLERYLNELIRAGATLLCDVRRNAVSRKYGFSKKTLSRACSGVGLRYVHMPELGIESSLRRTVVTGEDLRDLLAWYRLESLPSASDSLRRIIGWLEAGDSVALTCFEHRAEECHRHCVGDSISEFGYGVEHLRVT